MTKIIGLDFISAVKGTLFVDDTAAHTGVFAGFRVDADAVVSACLDDSGNSLMSNLGLAGATLPAGTIVSTASIITSITLTSGKITLINS